MRASVVLIVLAFLAVAASSSHAAVTTPSAFCTKYTTALYTTGSNVTLQDTFFDAVIKRAATGCFEGVGSGLFCENPAGHTADVYPAFTGLFHASSPLLAAFTAAPDYVTNATAYAVLVEDFTSFFGVALGCSFTPAVAPPTRWSTLFGATYLDQTSFAYFNTALLTSFASFGVEQPDLDEVVAPYLQSFGRCSGPREICSVDGCEIATNSISAVTGTNVQPGCVTRENLRLTQVKIDAVIKKADDNYDKYAVPLMGVTAAHFALIIVVLALAAVVVHRSGKGMVSHSRIK